MIQSVKNIIGKITYNAFVIVSIVLLALSYLSAYVDPAKLWFMTIFGLGYLPILLLNIILFIRSVFKHYRIAAISFIALLPSFFLAGNYVQLVHQNKDIPSNTIKIVTYNVGRYSFDSKNESRARCVAHINSFLRDQEADVICLQEVYVEDVRDISRRFKKNFPEHYLEYYVGIDKKGACGNVILSRFPVVSKGKFSFDKSANLAVYADLDIGDKVVRVYNCHFESYNISLPGIVKSTLTKENVKRTETKMRKTITRRPSQVDNVMNDIEQCSLESIVTGDFNDTPLSYTYTRLSRGRKDAFVESGFGFGATYSMFQPFLRIDFILYPKKGESYSYDVPELPYSDHYPVVVELSL